MRIFEIILLLLVTLLPFIKRRITNQIKPILLVGIISFIVLLHLVIEGWRWQMEPAYLMVLSLIWRILAIRDTPVKLSFLRVSGFVAILTQAIIGWTIPIVLPLFTLPEPTGPYAVGTSAIHHVTNQDEKITTDPTDMREFMYKIWYPGQASTSGFSKDTYIYQGSRSGFATKYGLPPNALS